MNKPLDRLRYHVTGAVERGEAVAIVERTIGKTGLLMDLIKEYPETPLWIRERMNQGTLTLPEARSLMELRRVAFPVTKSSKA